MSRKEIEKTYFYILNNNHSVEIRNFKERFLRKSSYSEIFQHTRGIKFELPYLSMLWFLSYEKVYFNSQEHYIVFLVDLCELVELCESKNLEVTFHIREILDDLFAADIVSDELKHEFIDRARRSNSILARKKINDWGIINGTSKNSFYLKRVVQNSGFDTVKNKRPRSVSIWGKAPHYDPRDVWHDGDVSLTECFSDNFDSIGSVKGKKLFRLDGSK